MAIDYRLNAHEEELNEAVEGIVEGERGAIGYIVLWLLGAPASLLFIIFLLRGCN